MPFFTIIIPTFNSSKHLHSCLKSIINQTFLDFEVIIIDGLSHDATVDIAISFHDSRIKILSEKDKGIYDAMNKGIRYSQGEWLYFIGSDDRLYSDTILSSIFLFLGKNHQAKFVYGDILLEGNNLPTKKKIKRYDIIKGSICHQAIFYKTSLFDELGEYSTDFKYISDWIFNIKVFLANYEIKYIEKTIAIFGTSGESNSNALETVAEYNDYRKKVIKSLSIIQWINYKFHNGLQKIFK